jgi:ATP-dependent RNA helicase DDX18/HAS1
MGSDKKKSKKGSRRENPQEAGEGTVDKPIAPTSVKQVPTGSTPPKDVASTDDSKNITGLEVESRKTKRETETNSLSSDGPPSGKRKKKEEETEVVGSKDVSDEKPNFFSAEMFDCLPLSEKTVTALRELEFTRMTQIQAKATPPLLTGKDLIGAAKTGSGKTLVRVPSFVIAP